MHSDLDADRMDYLIRDSHYTGLKYGQFDRDFILANLETFRIPSGSGKGKTGFGVSEDALHAVEDFLISRFNWYSQVIRNPESAKYDVVATHLAKAFLEKNLIYHFDDLLSMIENRGERFFWWNDVYFINRCQEIRYNQLIRDPKVEEMIEMLIYRKSAKIIRHPSLERRMIPADRGNSERKKVLKSAKDLIQKFENAIDQSSKKTEVLIADIPDKTVVFTSAGKSAKTDLSDRDAIKIISKEGTPSLLTDMNDSLMKHLSGLSHFIPNVYGNESALKLFHSKKLLQ